jgi:hypothetical protein
MDTKSNQGIKTKLNELAVNHNRLTTLCGFLLNEISGLKKEMQSMKSNNSSGNYNQTDIKTINTSDSMHSSQANQASRSSQNNFNNNIRKAWLRSGFFYFIKLFSSKFSPSKTP